VDGATVTPSAVADYEVVRLLGEGNHGRFWLARPPARLGLSEEFVALKVFGDRVGEQAYERGVRELRAFAAVRSPYLVRVFDAVLEDTFVYAMEYFPHGSLAAPARALARTDVLTALEHAARAAHALHEAGLAHGDIKPGNVLLAGSVDHAPTGGRLSTSAWPATSPRATRSPAWVAPARWSSPTPTCSAGARPSRRTEVWSLGATVHRALSGAGLHGDLPDTQPLLAIRRVLSGTPQVHPSLAPAEAALVRACLAEGTGRLTTAEQVADGLAALRTS
jgi:serine/threonine protein kinase